MGDIDEYLQSRKLQEAEEALEEAKRRLADEKNHLKDEQKKAKVKESRHHEDSSDDDHPHSSHHDSDDEGSSYSLKPWMLWNLIILCLIIILFGVSMFYPKSEAVDYAKIDTAIDSKLQAQQKEITSLKTQLADKADDSADKKAAEKALADLESAAVGPRFTLNAKDEEGNTIGNKGSVELINGTTIDYLLIVENKEKEIIRCDADRKINNNTKTKYFENLKVGVLEIEDIPQEVTNSTSNTVKVIYEFSCHFEDDTDTSDQSIEFTSTFK
ncbi:MAG TPA: hypothetical protein VJC07_03480 [Candidatus Nanoarchaeia archaeon]|nr:hypothetical protein [Candidatus Nanoarchaeia archaeon]